MDVCFDGKTIIQNLVKRSIRFFHENEQDLNVVCSDKSKNNISRKSAML